MEAVQPKVTQSMNSMLVKEFQAGEVHKPLKQMYPLKAPGPDGMFPLFFQKFWSIVGGVVTKTVLDFLNLGITPPKFNETHIVLVPKINSPERVTEYRPISLCNVIYKLASKNLANRLKKFLPSVINDTQSTFVNARLITDNVLVAFEAMHQINLKKLGAKGEMAFKLDISKAYDRVKWACLDKIMEKLGFHSRWRSLMMQCITSVTYAVRVNGKPSGHIIPSKGLCQGDPLFPYLFLICAEGLSALIKKATTDGLLEDVSVCMGGRCLSHLFFVNDSLIFYKATIEECEALQKVLCTYEQASGQWLNRAKTSLFFSPNTIKEIQDEIKVRFGAQVIRQHEKYLCLPSLVGRNKKNTFKEVKTKLVKKLAGWKEKLLSKAGKEVLIMAVAQAIPTYTMNYFKILDSLCDEMTSIIRNSWWGQCKEERKMA